MNKKIILLSLLTTMLIESASDATAWLELKPSYFFFYASTMKHIYKHGGFEIQGSASIPVCDTLNFYGSVGYRKLAGHALNSCEKTTLTVVPIDIGLKPMLRLRECLYSFFAFGPRYFHLHQHNKSPYVDCKINGNGIGFFVNAGLQLLLTDCLAFGIFGEGSYEKKKICSNKENVFSNGREQIGGIAFGVSLGYHF